MLVSYEVDGPELLTFWLADKVFDVAESQGLPLKSTKVTEKGAKKIESIMN